MEPTKLELIDGFEPANSGFRFVGHSSNTKVSITGSDWSEMTVLIHGSKSNEEATNFVNSIVSQIRSVGQSVEVVKEATISNISVSGDFGFSPQLEDLVQVARDAGYEAEYEPEQFSGAKLRTNDENATFLIFSTGSFVLQGVRSKNQIEELIDEVYSSVVKRMVSTE